MSKLNKFYFNIGYECRIVYLNETSIDLVQGKMILAKPTHLIGVTMNNDTQILHPEFADPSDSAPLLKFSKATQTCIGDVSYKMKYIILSKLHKADTKCCSKSVRYFDIPLYLGF